MRSGLILSCLLCLIPAACGERGVGSADAGGDGLLAQPDLRPSPDQGPQNRVWISTDRSSYGLSQAVIGTVHNDSSVPIFLPGCAIFSRDHLQDGVWVDRGDSIDCGWEGNAVEVAPGKTRSQAAHLTDPGAWRLVLGYGTGCKQGVPLSQAGCSGSGRARSPVVTALTDLATCDGVNRLYRQRLEAARKCDDSQGANKCRQLVQGDLACGCPLYVDDASGLEPSLKRWQALGCHALYGPCGIRCRQPSAASCVKGLCTSPE